MKLQSLHIPIPQKDRCDEPRVLKITNDSQGGSINIKVDRHRQKVVKATKGFGRHGKSASKDKG